MDSSKVTQNQEPYGTPLFPVRTGTGPARTHLVVAVGAVAHGQGGVHGLAEHVEAVAGGQGAAAGDGAAQVQPGQEADAAQQPPRVAGAVAGGGVARVHWAAQHRRALSRHALHGHLADYRQDDGVSGSQRRRQP